MRKRDKDRERESEGKEERESGRKERKKEKDKKIDKTLRLHESRRTNQNIATNLPFMLEDVWKYTMMSVWSIILPCSSFED